MTQGRVSGAFDLIALTQAVRSVTLQNRRKESEAGQELGSTKPRSARGNSGCSWLCAQLEEARAGMWWCAEWSLLVKDADILEISKEDRLTHLGGCRSDHER